MFSRFLLGLACVCRLSKYHSQKPESTRRKIFNRNSTLQHFVQISSGSVNSSVRTRAKTHGRTPVSIELPRGRHLGSKCLHLLGPDTCIIRGSNALIIAQECTARGLRCL